MRQEVESIAKGLLHILKDLDEPGKSKIADDYVKAIHENMLKWPANPSRVELSLRKTKKKTKPKLLQRKLLLKKNNSLYGILP